MTLKKLLFVDDRTKRIHSALSNYAGLYEVTIATNVKEALRALSGEGWDFVSLDHDLTGYDFEDPDTPTCGMEIVRYIEKTGWPPNLQRPVFIVHSSNVFAAYLMTTRLQKMNFIAYEQRFIYDGTVEHTLRDKSELALVKGDNYPRLEEKHNNPVLKAKV